MKEYAPPLPHLHSQYFGLWTALYIHVLLFASTTHDVDSSLLHENEEYSLSVHTSLMILFTQSFLQCD